METIEDLQQMVSLYQIIFPGEQEELNALIQFLKMDASAGLYNRNNFKGHITAGAFVVDESHTSLLLLHHKKLNRWLQPGGHVDDSDQTLVQAALRETVEESGLPASSLELMNAFGTKGLIDIDSHHIPANVNKNEPAHIHHDLRFLFTCNATKDLNLNPDEALGFIWQPLQLLKDDSTFGRVANKLQRCFDGRHLTIIADKLV